MPAAKKKAVVLFPRNCISTGLPYTRARTLYVTKDRIIVEVAEGPDESGAGIIYELDYGLRVMSVVPDSVRIGQLTNSSKPKVYSTIVSTVLKNGSA